jgi:hypothetical protein
MAARKITISAKSNIILPFMQSRRSKRGKSAISLIVRPRQIFSNHCEGSPNYMHQWEDSFAGGKQCKHCAQNKAGVQGNVINMVPLIFNTEHCLGSPNHEHCWHGHISEGQPELIHCCWCVQWWQRQPGMKVTERAINSLNLNKI